MMGKSKQRAFFRLAHTQFILSFWDLPIIHLYTEAYIKLGTCTDARSQAISLKRLRKQRPHPSNHKDYGA